MPGLGAFFEELEEVFGDPPCLRVAWGAVVAGAGSVCRPDGVRKAVQMKVCARWKVGAEDEAVRGRVAVDRSVQAARITFVIVFQCVEPSF